LKFIGIKAGPNINQINVYIKQTCKILNNVILRSKMRSVSEERIRGLGIHYSIYKHVVFLYFKCNNIK
jgi:hypothetical protein